jgi:hypothetical protein
LGIFERQMVDTRISLDHEIGRERFVFRGLRPGDSKRDRNRDQSNTETSKIDSHDFLSAFKATKVWGPLTGPYLEREKPKVFRTLN